MTLPSDPRVNHAIIRFGLGAKPGEVAKVQADPKGWLKAQLVQPAIPQGLKSYQTDTSSFDALNNNDDKEMQKELRRAGTDFFQGWLTASYNNMRETETPLYERLVRFWTNHFAVSILKSKQKTIPLMGLYEMQAIRPHVTGKFEDLLLASVRHSAMLIYLDNAQSVGPESMALQERKEKAMRKPKNPDKPQKTKKVGGLNENLAREIMELHTLGVNGGYTQADVISLAKLITGWSLKRPDKSKPVAEFMFFPALHEPGAKTLLGKTYTQGGEAEGEAALRDIARHPSTAKFIATKLARHFIADEPPAAAVAALEQRFMQSGGDLKAVMETLIDLDAAWTQPLVKFRDPWDYMVAAGRLCQKPMDSKQVVNALKELNFNPYAAPAPTGYPDNAAQWITPDSVRRRVEWAYAFAEKLKDVPPPEPLAQSSYGSLISENTITVIHRAASERNGLALLIASPEFQRR